MAKDDMVGTLLTLGIVGAGAYFLWPTISRMFTSVAPAASTPTSAAASPSTPSAPSVTCGAGTMLQNGQCVPSTIPDPCAAYPGFVAMAGPAISNGVWSPTMAAVAAVQKVSSACIGSLQAQAQAFAASKGIGGLGRNYIRRGTPMRWTGRRYV